MLKIGHFSLDPPDSSAPEPIYRQVATAIESGIREGRLRVGQRLPAERRLAAALGVSRTTATNAYRELEARGILRGRVGHGTTIVAAPEGAAAEAIDWGQRPSRFASEIARSFAPGPAYPTDTISFAGGWPDPSLYPRAALDAIARRLHGRAGHDVYAPAPAEGDPALREALAAWLSSMQIAASPDQVIVTAGAQEGLNLLARAFLAPGDVVLTERPTWAGAILAFRWAGAEVVGLPMDGHGLRSDVLEEAIARHRPKLLYTIPTFHNPTGALMGGERRRQILEIATRCRVPIVESDLYGQLFFEAPPPAPLKSLDGAGLVIYQGSFSKMAVPGLRVGWLVAPTHAVEPLIAAKMLAGVFTSTLAQRLVAGFIGQGHLEPHLALLRREYRVRRDRLVGTLRERCPKLAFAIPAGGQYLWTRLPAPLVSRDLLAACREAGVAVREGAAFAPDGSGDDFVRLCFAALPLRKVGQGAERLAEAITRAERLLTPRRGMRPRAELV